MGGTKVTRSEKIKYVREQITYPALFEGVAEEAMELAQAAMKMARIYRFENPTPAGAMEVMKNVKEEATDLRLCLDALSGKKWRFDMSVYDRKLDRWVERIQKRKEIMRKYEDGRSD